MTAIGVAFTASGGSVHNVVVDTFGGGEVARTYAASATFQRGLSGQQVMNGQPGRQKFIWAVNGVLPEADAKELDDLFKAWDADRGTGLAAAVGITDQTLFDPVTTSAIFSTPPSFIRFGPNSFSVAFGLTEV